MLHVLGPCRRLRLCCCSHKSCLLFLQLTDGGVIANNPAMAAMTFASTKYGTAFVAPQKGKKSLAVLSLGCGTSSELKCDAVPDR